MERYNVSDPSGDASAWGLAPEEIEQQASKSGPSIAGGGMMGTPAHPSVAPRTQQAERHFTPEELMAMADAMEQRQRQEHEARMSMGPAVHNDPTVPNWLTDYMAKQPHTDPYHFPDVRREDIIKKNKYATDEDKEKIRKYRMYNEK
jgi:hypothetical protein